MRGSTEKKLTNLFLPLFIGAVLISCLIAVGSPLLGKEPLDVKRDETKTVYTIESSDANRQDGNSQTEKSWDMLRNMGILLDKRHGTATQMQPPNNQSAPVTGK